MSNKQKLYISLYEKLKNQIIEGQYQANDKFPSKRQLSEHLSLSHTTIEHAYQLLLDEGFIYSKPRSGYYVSDIQALPIVNTNDYQINNDKEENIESRYKYAFNLAEIDAEYFPLHLFRKYAKEVFEDNQLALLEKGDIQGELSLRQQIAHYLFNSRGVSSHPKQIIIGSSTEQLLNMVTELLKDSSFIIEKPSYPPIKQVLDKKNRDYIQATVEKDGINTNQVIHSNNDILYITPSHQFPTGYVMNLKKRTQLIKWAHQKEERYIIEDDYDSEFRYYGKPIPALQSLDKNEKVIYISTFSKSLFPSCRIAYVVLPNKLLQKYYDMSHKESNTVPVHIQHIIANFMASGSFERHLNKMRRIYREKLDYILKRLEPYKDQLLIEGALTGMHFTIKVKNGLTLEECIENAEQLNLKLKVYNYDSIIQTHPKFILGFGGIPNEELETHTDALIKALTL
ncbi:GntR family transcriptional regulator [Staphylococcus petrasii]|uniref:GntR family transcriptional regulator n=1 Tax=Staphylococcus petrasii TaxID=1276936 RepID=A0A380G3R6_9STAP|nr:PLP-dependent aminotransferase family protein [Staphylococcus petrasii]PNZ30806.1 PLP-dependent aminotransferase family protein [Staphylococcus petrasii]TGE11045.1 PLP-dependent aminotransferase family protein [Staphylococcus petrasii]TGE16525.1 PLP-dependent aminotransferase family protein [Staphylococcus petrasii]SUM45116.1 GntR family transcriptional regulator [Staphylococcus petrasii]